METIQRSFPRTFWYSVTVAILCSTFSLLWELVQPGPHAVAQMGDNLIQPLGAFVSLAIGLSGKAQRGRYDGSGSSRLQFAQRWIRTLYLLTTLSPCTAILIVLYYHAILHQTPPTPSWADFVALLTYPFLVMYFLLMPTRKLHATGRSRRMLDSMLILGSLILFNWYFILGPILLQGVGITPIKLTASAYPIGNLVILYFFLYMASRTSSDASARPAILLFAGSMLIVTGCLSIYAYLSVQHMYTSGGMLDWALQVGYILFGLATQALRLAPGSEPKAADGTVSAQENRPLISSTWLTLLPYFLLLLIITLTIYSWRNGGNGLREMVIYGGCIVLVLLSFLRQLVVVREITTYARTTMYLNEALAEANNRLEVLSTTDPLTKLLNRGALLTHLDQEIERAKRNGHPLSVLFFDGDHFKRVNDTYGHGVGDAVLCELGNRAQAILRTGDTVGRYGGEEFVVLLPETDPLMACDIAERLRLAVATHPLIQDLVEGGLTSTISMGVATFPLDGQTGSEVLDQADQAMYWAKRLGRNQIKTVLEAKRASQDSTLVATIAQLERSDGLPTVG